MNILLFYADNPWTAIIHLEKAFLVKNDVTVFDLKKTPYWGDFGFRFPFYIPKGIPVSVSQILRKYKKNFDVIIEIDTFGQYHITGLKKTNIPKFLWATDVYRFDKRKFQKWIAKDFDTVFVSQKNFVDVFSAEGRSASGGKPIKSYWLPYAAEPEIHKKFDLPKIYDIIFVGNTNPKVYPERVKLLKLIGEKFNLKVFSGVYGEDLAKIYSQAKIVFNKSCAGEINLRVFEALSCGSLLLTDRLKPEAGLEELFQDKKHLVLYDNEKDLLEKIDYYLKHESEREEIALSGHKEVLAKHTYEHRAEKMLKMVTGNL